MKGHFLRGQWDVWVRAAVVVLCFTFIFTLYPMLTPEVRAWSGTTHEFVASQAIALMPHSYDWFFSTYSSTIVSYSTKPDAWKSSDPNEGYRHYYDYDLYTTHTHSEQQQPANGVLPWALEDNFNMLVQYLRNSDWTHAAQLAGVICHYTGDASMPLHATSDYWLGGAHTDYETEINGHLGEITISSYVPHELGNVFDATMATLVDSYGYTDSTHTDPTKLSYWLLQPQPFWNYDTVRSITQSRLNAAVQLTANVWYTAMVQAGTPLLIWPENGVYLFDNTPTFKWTSVSNSSGVTYQIQIDDNSDFGSPVYYAVNLTENTRTLPDENALALGTYFWRVRAKDNAGNVGDWSSVWMFFVCTQTSWVQTDWKGGPKPELQVGTWDSTYDNFYDNENVDWSQAGKVTLKAFPGSQQVIENLTPPAADSYVRASSAGSNYGTSTSIYVGYSSGAERGYLKFDLSSIPSNRMIIQAKLWVYNYSVSGGGAYVKVERVDDDSWTESGITWNNQPARTALLVSPQSLNSGTTWFSWTSSTLTSFVAAQYDGDKIVSIALIDTGENNSSSHYARFNSKEYSSGTYAPKLEVTYLNAFYENGWFESSIFDAGKVVEWRSISWSENKPSGTNIVVKARTGGDNDPRDGGWSGWYQHTNGSENTLMENGRYIQYRVELSTTDNTKTPEFYDITIAYDELPLPIPTKPQLLLPENGTTTSDNTPTFIFILGELVDNHRLLVDNDNDFSSPNENRILFDNTYTIADENALPDGIYYWKVVAINVGGEYESDVWWFRVDTITPVAPTLVSPDNGAMIIDHTPMLDWNTVAENSTPVLYQAQVDSDSDFGSSYDSGWISASNWTTPELVPKVWYWRVKAKDNAGNVGDWSEVRWFKILPNWNQTTWNSGQTTPSLQVGTWNANYDNYYIGKNENDANGELKLCENVLYENDTAVSTDSHDWIMVKQYTTTEAGSERITFDLAGSWSEDYDDIIPARGQIWRNGVPVGTEQVSQYDIEGYGYYGDGYSYQSFTETIGGWNVGDNVQLWIYTDDWGVDSLVHTWVFEVSYYKPNAYIESSIYDATYADWEKVNWNATMPTGTSIGVKLRSGNDNNPYDGGWSGWCQFENNTENASLPNARYVQYRIELSTIDNTKTPELLDITINYAVGGKVSFTLNLRAGWNMVSFPVQPDNVDPDSVFPGYYVMYRWNAASPSYVLCGGSPVEPDEPIAPGVGYWVFVMADENVVVSGTPVDNLTLSLSGGWNLIGTPLGGGSIADPDDDPDNSVLRFAYTWQNGSYVLTTDNLVAGAGYWVFAMNSCELRLPGAKMYKSLSSSLATSNYVSYQIQQT